MTRFRPFTDKELDAIESAFRNEGLESFIEEIHKEKEWREEARKWWSGINNG